VVVGSGEPRPRKGETVSGVREIRLAMTVGRVVKVKVFMMISDWYRSNMRCRAALIRLSSSMQARK
jgi:hypothetical protein